MNLTIYKDGAFFASVEKGSWWVLDLPYQVKVHMEAYMNGMSDVNTFKGWRWQKSW